MELKQLGHPGLPTRSEGTMPKLTTKRHRSRGFIWSVVCALIVGSYFILGRLVLAPSTYLPEDLPANDSEETVLHVRPVPVGTAESRHIGGLPGFQVFENVWYSDDTIRFFRQDGLLSILQSDSVIPDKDEVVSGNVSFQVSSWSDLRADELAKAGQALNWYGNTLFINDGRVPSFIQHYYHFVAEVLVGGIAALSAALTKSTSEHTHLKARHHEQALQHAGFLDPKVDWAVTPWEPAWQDGPGLNELVFQGLFGDHGIRKPAWEELTKDGQWVYFERVVIIDRWASHRHHPSANAWNKMALPLLSLPFPSSFLRPSREAMFDYLGLNAPPTRIRPGASVSRVPKIVYVDRQNSWRQFEPAAQDGLLDVLYDLEIGGEARVRHVSWEDLSPRAQVEVMYDADIILGIHGNGLTHLLWMPEGGTVVEVFPPGVMIRDYEVLTKMLDMTHYAVWDNRVVPRAEWDTGSKGDEEAIHNGTQVPLDSAFIRSLLGEALRNMRAHREGDATPVGRHVGS